MKATVTLTPEESRRFIAWAVAEMDIVKKAMKDRIIALSLCTSSGYVAEELLGQKIDMTLYCCGYIHEDGWCYMPPDSRVGPKTGELILKKGKPIWLRFPEESISDYISGMGPEDVIVKSGNVRDSEGRVGCLLGDPDGGEAGRYIPHILGKGIKLIVPTTINKTLPVHLDQLTSSMGTKAIQKKYSYGLVCGMMPLPGIVVTEIEAFKWLSHVEALPVAAGGFGSGAGCVSFLLQGAEEDVKKAWKLVGKVKGEPSLKDLIRNCRDCAAPTAASPLTCSTRRSPKGRRAPPRGGTGSRPYESFLHR
jgi:hypothetical protein